MIKYLTLFIFFLMTIPFTYAQTSVNQATTQPASQEPQTIILKDGSQIKGKLIGVQGNSYTFETSSFGNVTLDAANVVTITSRNTAPVLPAGQAFPGQNAPPTVLNVGNSLNPPVGAVQQQLMADPQMLSEIQTIAQDPELMQIFSDPEFAKAILAQDMQKIQSNPKTQTLLTNPKMQELMRKMQQKYGGPAGQ